MTIFEKTFMNADLLEALSRFFKNINPRQISPKSAQEMINHFAHLSSSSEHSTDTDAFFMFVSAIFKVRIVVVRYSKHKTPKTFKCVTKIHCALREKDVIRTIVIDMSLKPKKSPEEKVGKESVCSILLSSETDLASRVVNIGEQFDATDTYFRTERAKERDLMESRKELRQPSPRTDELALPPSQDDAEENEKNIDRSERLLQPAARLPSDDEWNQDVGLDVPDYVEPPFEESQFDDEDSQEGIFHLINLQEQRSQYLRMKQNLQQER
jgi:hypothetical protein